MTTEADSSVIAVRLGGQISVPNPTPVHFNRFKIRPSPQQPSAQQKNKLSPRSGRLSRGGDAKTPSESSTTCRIAPRKGEGRPNEESRPSSSGQLASGSATSAALSHSFNDHSLLEIIQSENVSPQESDCASSISNEKVQMEVVRTPPIQEELERSAKSEIQCSTPWRKANTSETSSADFHFSTAEKQNTGSICDKVIPTSKPKMMTAKLHQSQLPKVGGQTGILKVSVPPSDDAPWRSPQPKRKDILVARKPLHPPVASSNETSPNSLSKVIPSSHPDAPASITITAEPPVHPTSNPPIQNTNASENENPSSKIPVPSTAEVLEPLPQEQQGKEIGYPLEDQERSSKETETIKILPEVQKETSKSNDEREMACPPPPHPIKMAPSVTRTHTRPATLNLQQDLSEENSPEFTNEPITSRIQKFERQVSFAEMEKKEKTTPVAKPVGPWVKKTSTGPVSRGAWDQSWQSGHVADVAFRGPAEVSYQRPHAMSNAGPHPPIVVQGVSAEDEQESQGKNLRVLKPRSRAKSGGDFSHSYIDQDGKPSLSRLWHAFIPLGFPFVCPIFLSLLMGFDLSELVGQKASTRSTSGSHPVTKAEHSSGDLADPWCDPANPRVIQFQDVSAASFKIKSGILNTPCMRSNISSLVNMEIYFKKEFNQITGSFKERGSRYTLLCLPDDQKSRGVIAASAGNHALALAYHGQDLGIPITVVMPVVAPIMKVQACRQYGANVLVKGKDIGECKEIALHISKEKHLLYINGYDHPHILAGQGTMGLEIVEQVPNIDAVLVPIGGGGLIAGVALAVKSLFPHIKVIGVEPERCASFSAALKAGRPVFVEMQSSLADGLAVPMVGVNAFATARTLVDKVVTVKEEWIAIAILRLVEMEKAVVEGAGAAALGAILAGELPELTGKKVIIPLCGGNIDTTVLGRCLERGLAADGRLVKFTVTVSDRPGGIADLTRVLANLGVSIKDMLHERAWIRNDIFSVEVKVLCETRDHEHSEELRQILLQKYQQLRFGSVSE